eukprot:12173680-Alexandrium_andersonii.AAC.1
MWDLMFVCTNEACKFANKVALVCSQCKKALPVLREMPSFLMMWHRATVDLRASYRRGERRAREVDRA